MTTITILTPQDIKVGSVSPSGARVTSVSTHFSSQLLVKSVELDDGTFQVFTWPTGDGWVVDGCTAAPRN